uniref:alpha-2C adrenergic receptor isoform X2 n=1 Tax=Ciona intestinalis TaxID=7719 RepID=UPI00089DB953|nr:alpha-2C adrenergic receptor isoform X2 [Ciona intestinalis]|eukprot:XP_018668148.1 alpha-2C adrenergic receptor isoform X2 [Ciona intestinalis]
MEKALASRTEAINATMADHLVNIERDCLGNLNISSILYSEEQVVIFSALTSILCIIGLFGNLTVIVVIRRDRVIYKHRQNLYLLSLAVADVSLVVLVVPFSITNELLGYWPFGTVYCRIYLSVDILLCTASIWNICMIGLDRYISVKYPMTYRKFRTMPKIRLFIVSIWLFAAVVSLLPFVSEIETINSERGCFINASSWYIVVSCSLSFFIPSCIIWPVYIRIYMIGRDLEISKRARHSSNLGVVIDPRRQSNGNHIQMNMLIRRSDPKQDSTSKFETKVRRLSRTSRSLENLMTLLVVPNSTNNSRSVTSATTDQRQMNRSQSFTECLNSGREDGNLLSSVAYDVTSQKESINGDVTKSNFVKRLQSLSSVTTLYNRRSSSQSQQSSCTTAMSRRERRFVCIISIITGCFMACWMPFFLTYMIYAVCRACCINNTLFKVFFWLGYLNSALNPVLYTAFNKDFRSAFQRLFHLSGRRTIC